MPSSPRSPASRIKPRSSSPRCFRSAMFGLTRCCTHSRTVAGCRAPPRWGDDRSPTARAVQCGSFLSGWQALPFRFHLHSACVLGHGAQWHEAVLARHSLNRTAEAGFDQSRDDALTHLPLCCVSSTTGPCRSTGQQPGCPRPEGRASAGPAPAQRYRRTDRRAAAKLISTPFPKLIMVNASVHCHSSGTTDRHVIVMISNQYA